MSEPPKRQDPFAAVRAALKDSRIEVYVATWCWDCRRLKNFLEGLGVDFASINISHDSDAALRLETETGKRGVPYVLVNGTKWVAGYHPDESGKFNPEKFVQELAAALTAGSE